MEDDLGPPEQPAQKKGRKEAILTALRVAVLLAELLRFFVCGC